MALALAAYAAYLVNAVQFVLKLRAARLGAQTADAPAVHSGVAA
jgi:3-vinyl bacteriochlorophyllide hydratase